LTYSPGNGIGRKQSGRFAKLQTSSTSTTLGGALNRGICTVAWGLPSECCYVSQISHTGWRHFGGEPTGGVRFHSRPEGSDSSSSPICKASSVADEKTGESGGLGRCRLGRRPCRRSCRQCGRGGSEVQERFEGWGQKANQSRCKNWRSDCSGRGRGSGWYCRG
jgi:hypothetical protein